MTTDIDTDVIEPPAYYFHDDDDDDPFHAASSSSSSSPPPTYTLTRSRSEYTFPSPTDYVYASKRITLNLGGRINHTPVPSYGRNATIAGSVSVGGLGNVKDVSVTISGTASTTLTDPSLGNAVLLTERRTFLSHTVSLYSSSRDHNRGSATVWPFTFSLSTLPGRPSLPPSCTARTPTIKFSVRYRITVDMTRGGFRRHEALGTYVLYLPRSVPRPPVYVTPDPRATSLGSSAEAEWEAFVGVAVGGSGAGSPNVSGELARATNVLLHLPAPRSYTSGHAIPFFVTLPPTFPTRRRITVNLIKIVTVRTSKVSSSPHHQSPLELVLQTGHIYGWERREEGGGSGWKVRGSLDAVKQGSEAAWSVGGFIDVRYAVRLAIPNDPQGSDSGSSGQIQCDVPVELVTDTPDAFPENDVDGWERPAVGLMFSAGMGWR